MKYIIILLTSLFLVSNASAEEEVGTYQMEVVVTKEALSHAWILNTKTGEVRICQHYRFNIVDEMVCSSSARGNGASR